MTAQFDDGKEDGALRTIGDVSRALGIKTHVLRYWEQQFQMLEPLKRSGGRRYYRSEDVDLIETIDRLVNSEGYTLKGAQQAIENGKAADSAGKADVVNDAPSTENRKPAMSEPEAAQPVSPEAKPVIADNVDPASDGGVDAFFGKPSEVEEEPELAAEQPDVPVEEIAEPELSREEVLAKLKDIRTRLAEAIAA